MNAKIVPYSAIHYGKLAYSRMCASSFRMLIQSIVYSTFNMFIVFPQDALTRFVSEWSPCTFINVLASNQVIKLINTGTSTCHSTSFIGNRLPGFYSDKYGTYTWKLTYTHTYIQVYQYVQVYMHTYYYAYIYTHKTQWQYRPIGNARSIQEANNPVHHVHAYSRHLAQNFYKNFIVEHACMKVFVISSSQVE